MLTEFPARTAETLMRSRYTAFVVGDYDYLDRTHAAENRGEPTRPAGAGSETDVEWIGLTICGAAKGGPDDDTGTVEFKARFRQGGATLVHHELSRFRRDDGRWVYVDGTFNPAGKPAPGKKVGRNDPCICGSGKKFKLCCG